jgi:signal peptidase I
MGFLEDVWSGENEIFEWFYFLALALILAFGTISTSGTLLDTERPVVSVFSCSMYPEYQRGDILLVKGTDFSDVEVEDVIVYKVPDRVDFSVSGESYTLEKDSPQFNTSIQTSVGKVELLEVMTDLEPGRDGDDREEVVLSVDGERKVLEEGSSGRISIKRASAMPIPVVHRVVEKNEDSLETRGDANEGQLDFESDVRPFQVHGKAFFKVPLVGALKILAMDFVGFQGDKPFVFDVYRTCG